MQVTTFKLSLDSGPIPAPASWDGPGTLVLAFFAPEMALEPKALQRLRDTFPRSFILGASSGGGIFGPRLEDHSAVVALLRFATTGLSLAREEVTSFESSGEAGASLAQALGHPDLRGLFVLTSGMGVNGAEVVQGLNQALSRGVPVTGGVAAGGEESGPTFTISARPGEPLDFGSHQVVGVGFRGTSLRLSSTSKGGWTPFGLERQVTGSRRNVLYELDGRPALSLYKTYLGERAQDLPLSASLFPLAILGAQAEGADALVRSVLSMEEADQSLVFGGDIPEGSVVQLMHSSVDRLVDAAAQAAESLDGPGGLGSLCLAVSCLGRRIVLGDRTEEELEAVYEALPEGTPLLGFYGQGELSPDHAMECHLHNQTMTLTLIWEE